MKEERFKAIKASLMAHVKANGGPSVNWDSVEATADEMLNYVNKPKRDDLVEIIVEIIMDNQCGEIEPGTTEFDWEKNYDMKNAKKEIERALRGY